MTAETTQTSAAEEPFDIGAFLTASVPMVGTFGFA